MYEWHGRFERTRGSVVCDAWLGAQSRVHSSDGRFVHGSVVMCSSGRNIARVGHDAWLGS